MKKKTTYLWIVLILSAIGVVLGLLGVLKDLVNYKVLFTSGVFNSPVINIIKFVLGLVGLILTTKFVFNLYNVTPDLVHWTDVTFGYTIFKTVLIFILGFFVPGGALLILLLIPFIIMIGIYVLIWLTFKKHLKKAKESSLMNFA